jgi:hypothetical protein
VAQKKKNLGDLKNMLKIVKYEIITNIALSLLYVISSYLIWTDVSQWSKWNTASIWSPLLITAYHIPNTPQVQMPVGPAWNLPFILFWVMLAVNLFFIVKLQKSKQTKQISS